MTQLFCWQAKIDACKPTCRQRSPSWRSVSQCWTDLGNQGLYCKRHMHHQDHRRHAHCRCSSLADHRKAGWRLGLPKIWWLQASYGQTLQTIRQGFDFIIEEPTPVSRTRQSNLHHPLMPVLSLTERLRFSLVYKTACRIYCWTSAVSGMRSPVADLGSF